ncbi:hypothetical protein ABII15_38170 [Streptomyces sp. HUAS MG91]|uniref:Uncharacterized protein n=1 Tax=Streptomyces tabacisoli TaxID=3156398 RepID=A0AAU8J3S8_9ACTN
MSGPISVNRSNMVHFGAVGLLVLCAAAAVTSALAVSPRWWFAATPLGAAADSPAGWAADRQAADLDGFTG